MGERVGALTEPVQQIVDAYLQIVDEDTPGLVDGLYLVGSIALGEFRQRTSDIDFVAVTASLPDARALDALGRAHRRLRARYARPHFDGCYVTRPELTQDPRAAGAGPYSYEGRFHLRGARDCNPITWHTLADCGFVCRGPEPGTLEVWTDRAALRAWTLDNFDRYWRPLVRTARRGVGLWGLTSFTSYGAVWIVLGVCRLHYTLATGRVASKEEAGRYGLDTFPQRWHLVLNEALRIRRADRARADFASACAETAIDIGLRAAPGAHSLYESPVARRRDVLAFAEMVMADAPARSGPA